MSGFEPVTASSELALPFSDSKGRQPIPLSNGFVAIPTWTIRRANQSYTPEEISRANLMSFEWQIKGTNIKAPQRCPAVWVDNFCFLHTGAMLEPELLLGRWKKEVEVYGVKQSLEGLVIAGGGHYERCAKKSPIPSASGYGNGIVPEAGDVSLREAADKELKEEIGIDRLQVKATQEFGCMDDMLNDSRCHGIRHIFLRWVDQAPRPSSELSNVLSVPVSQMSKLYNREINWRSPDGKLLGMILNHDLYARLILEHPQTIDFISSIKQKAAGQHSRSGQMW